ncbi:25590_t:CDS:2 [Racocetra persica]|uniref:25590_t:CDS:1 n=1 Tax=Racocetra persica TaxID=160502 RepID=A0ACA9LA00_9GLOM|nr:25590_t:CDS:2 [Racocetra persica]
MATTMKEQRLLIKPTRELQHLTIKKANHNHIALEDILGYPSSYRLNKDDYQKVKKMFAADVNPRDIPFTLRQSNLNSLAISRTIYNT